MKSRTIMKLNIAQVIGLNTDQKAAQVIYQQRDTEGTFLAVLILSCDDAFTKGRQKLSELSDFYFDAEGTISEKLIATFEKASQDADKEGELSLLTGAISGKVFYLIGKGGVDVYLKRAEKVSPLLSVASAGQLISGFLNKGDRVLLATKSLSNFLGDDLSKTLTLPLDSFEQEVIDRIGSSDSQTQGLAGLLVSVEEEEQDIPGLPVRQAGLPQQEEQTMDPRELMQEDLKVSVAESIKKGITKILGLILKIRYYFPKSGRGRLVLAVVLITAVSLGALFQYKNISERGKNEQFQTFLQAAKDEFSASKGLASLNAQEAKLKLESAKAKVDEALSVKPNDQEAQDLKVQIEAETPVILNQFVSSNFPLYLDLDLVKKGFKATQLSLSVGKLLILDPDTDTLVTVDLAKKSHQIQAGSEGLGEAEISSVNGNFAFVYSKDKGIIRVDITNQKRTTVSKKDDDWGQILDIAGFASNIYLLDAKGNQIWKYLVTSEGYSDKREYLVKDAKVDLAPSLRMQIESSVYVLKSGGEMLRFTRGTKDNFNYEGLDQGIKDPNSFFVSSDSDNLYILDSGNSRLLILTKTGGYKGQVTGEKFATATDLVVDEKGKKVYLLEGSKIYMVDLK